MIRLANRRPKMKPYDARLTAFTPKLVTVLGEGYTFDRLRRDSIAGLTVAIVALPLAMALAIASGAAPDQGLIKADRESGVGGKGVYVMVVVGGCGIMQKKK